MVATSSSPPCWQRVRQARFLCIAGPSGSGKSSLVQAGLIHALRSGRLAGSRHWLYASLSPRSDPIEQLALAMARVAGKPDAADYLRSRGATDPTSLQQQAETLLSHDPAQRMILYIDQFEELFTQARNEDRRRSFLALLTDAVAQDDGRVTVILSMRSDFLSQCAAYPELLALINQQFQLVGAMTAQDLALAILKPALAVGAEIEPELVAQVIADMKGEPGALPLMQFALKDLFDAQPHKKGDVVKLTLSAYTDRGGIQEALERYANTTFAQFDDRQQEIARVVFSHLIEVGRGTLDTRRTATYDELITAEVDRDSTVTVINTLADARLVTTDTTENHQRTLAVAHEKLIEAWPWLRRLVNENREAIALQNEVADDAAEWDRNGRDPSYLYTGAKLATVREQLADKRIVLSGPAKAFVDAAEAEAEARRNAEEAARRHELEQAQALAVEQQRRAEEQTRAATRLRRRNRWLAGALAAALFAVVLALVFFLLRSRTPPGAHQCRGSAGEDTRGRTREGQGAARTRRAQAGELAAGAQVERAKPIYDPSLALLLARQAILTTWPADGYVAPSADSALQAAVAQRCSAGVAHEPAASSPHRSCQLCGLQPGRQDRSSPPVPTRPPASGMRPRGRSAHRSAATPAVSSRRPTARTARRSSPPVTTRPPASGMRPRGRSCASSPATPTLSGRRPTARTARPSSPPVTTTPPASGTRPRGRSCASSAATPRGQVCGLQPGRQDHRHRQCDQTARIWDAATGQELRQLSGHTAVSSRRPSARTARPSSPPVTTDRPHLGCQYREELRQLSGHTGAVMSAAYSPDGKTIVTASDDQTARIWDAATGQELRQLSGHTDAVYSAAYSPDGKTIVTASEDQTARIWDAATGQELRQLSGHTGCV